VLRDERVVGDVVRRANELSSVEEDTGIFWDVEGT